MGTSQESTGPGDKGQGGKGQGDKGQGARTLAIDIGATGLKAAVLDATGAIVVPRSRVETPDAGTPAAIVETLLALVRPMGAFDRISIGFPGVVRDGRVLTAPNMDSPSWRDFPLASVLAEHTGKPARMLNDASVHGLGVIQGKGLECVITLGTGMGFALFDNGFLTPHLELSHHPIHKGKDYDQYIGDAPLHRIGKKKWNKRVAHALACIRDLTGYDTLLIGGGNARHIKLELEPNIRLVSNDAGITGGVRLWDERLDPAFRTGGENHDSGTASPGPGPTRANGVAADRTRSRQLGAGTTGDRS